jgi:hypothetical protein
MAVTFLIIQLKVRSQECRFDHFGVHGAFALPAFMLICDIILRLMIREKKGNQ